MNRSRLTHGFVAVACLAAGCADAPRDGSVVARQSSADTLPGPTVSHGLPPIRPGEYPAGKGTPQHGGGVESGTWTTVANTPAIAAGFSLLLSDGSVMVQDLTNGGGDWWKLTPDASGSYVNGAWTQLPSMPNGYAPLYFASALLPDGRVIVIGGEYQAFQFAWQTQGAVYDPAANAWTSISGPPGWTTVGDAQSVVLADGRYVLANCCSIDMAVLDPTTLSWSPITSAGKADLFDEEGWTLLPDGQILTVDASNLAHPTHSEIYTPPDRQHVGGWSSAGSTVAKVADVNADGTGSYEIGPAMLRPDGTVFQSGATGHTAVYDVRLGMWSAGPDFPVVAGEGQLDQADGPAALLPSGNVLVAASYGAYNFPAHFLEFDGSGLTEVAAPASAQFDSSFNINLLLLPSGEVLETDFSNDVEIYREAASHHCDDDAIPSIGNGYDLLWLERGQTYDLRGRRLHGVSAGVSYGDDAQAATNYPLVRLRNLQTGHVSFARTHDFDGFSVARDAKSTAKFDVGATTESGLTELAVVANGVASDPLIVWVE
jgi:hypothetical protein